MPLPAPPPALLPHYDRMTIFHGYQFVVSVLLWTVCQVVVSVLLWTVCQVVVSVLLWTVCQVVVSVLLWSVCHVVVSVLLWSVVSGQRPRTFVWQDCTDLG